MEQAAIAAISAAATAPFSAFITGVFMHRSKRDEVRNDRVATLLEGYATMVTTLQAEINRLHEELAQMHQRASEMQTEVFRLRDITTEYEQQVQRFVGEIDYLRTEVNRLGGAG